MKFVTSTSFCGTRDGAKMPLRVVMGTGIVMFLQTGCVAAVPMSTATPEKRRNFMFGSVDFGLLRAS